MKKMLSILLIVAALVPGCGKKKEKKLDSKKDKNSLNMPLAQGKGKSAFFDEEAEAFVLEDEAKGTKVASAQADSWVADANVKQFKTLYFEFDKYDIRKDQEPLLAADIKEAQAIVGRGELVTVEGHACHSAGSKTYNLVLSEHRAQEVASKIKDAGIPQESLKVVGRGTEMPVVFGGNRDEQWPNRRVEFFSVSA